MKKYLELAGELLGHCILGIACVHALVWLAACFGLGFMILCGQTHSATFFGDTEAVAFWWSSIGIAGGIIAFAMENF